MRRPDPNSLSKEDPPCGYCGRPRLDPWHFSRQVDPRDPFHIYDGGIDDPGDLHHVYDEGGEVTGQLTEKQQRHRMIRNTRFYKGLLDPPLQSPAERRRIRKRVGLSQQDLADELVDRSGLHGTRQLHVTEHMVSRWEKPVGYGPGDVRLPGREPLGERRRAYAALLEELKRKPPAL